MSIHTTAAGNLHLARYVAERFLKPSETHVVILALLGYLGYNNLTSEWIEFQTRRLCIAYRFGMHEVASLILHLHSYLSPTVDVVSV